MRLKLTEIEPNLIDVSVNRIFSAVSITNSQPIEFVPILIYKNNRSLCIITKSVNLQKKKTNLNSRKKRLTIMMQKDSSQLMSRYLSLQGKVKDKLPKLNWITCAPGIHIQRRPNPHTTRTYDRSLYMYIYALYIFAPQRRVSQIHMHRAATS